MLEDTMFADSLLEGSWAQRARRSWTTLTSFGLQVVIVGVLLLLPLWRTVGLPSARTISTPISVGQRAEEAHATNRPAAAASARSNQPIARLVAPGHVPTLIRMDPDDSSAPALEGSNGGVGTVLPGVAATGILPPLISGTRTIVPTLPPRAARTFRTSNMLEGSLIRRVQPTYPPLARSARIQGSVVLYALISKAGTMENLHVLSGHPMLVPAAIDAVSQWRYRPYILNSEPIEVETQITVNFWLSGN
jgi:periplasmic protein TonB